MGWRCFSLVQKCAFVSLLKASKSMQNEKHESKLCSNIFVKYELCIHFTCISGSHSFYLSVLLILMVLIFKQTLNTYNNIFFYNFSDQHDCNITLYCNKSVCIISHKKYVKIICKNWWHMGKSNRSWDGEVNEIHVYCLQRNAIYLIIFKSCYQLFIETFHIAIQYVE